MEQYVVFNKENHDALIARSNSEKGYPKVGYRVDGTPRTDGIGTTENYILGTKIDEQDKYFFIVSDENREYTVDNKTETIEGVYSKEEMISNGYIVEPEI